MYFLSNTYLRKSCPEMLPWPWKYEYHLRGTRTWGKLRQQWENGKRWIANDPDWRLDP